MPPGLRNRRAGDAKTSVESFLPPIRRDPAMVVAHERAVNAVPRVRNEVGLTVRARRRDGNPRTCRRRMRAGLRARVRIRGPYRARRAERIRGGEMSRTPTISAMPRSRAVVLALALLVAGQRPAAGQPAKGAEAPDASASPKRLGRRYPAVTTLRPKPTQHPPVRVSVVHTQPANLGGRRAGEMRSGQPAGSQAGVGAQTPAAPGVPLGSPLR